MGLSFPALQRVVQTETGRVGRRVGTLMLANIIGSTSGTMLTGWVLLAVAGTAATAKLMVLLSGLFALLAWRLLRRESLLARGIAPALAACVLVTAAAMPPGTQLWAGLHGTTAGPHDRGGGWIGGVFVERRKSILRRARQGVRQRSWSEPVAVWWYPQSAWRTPRADPSGAAQRRHHWTRVGRHALRRCGAE